MINQWVSYFTSDFKHWEKIDFFKRVLYVFLFFNTLTLLPAVNDIFGYNGLAGTNHFIWNGSGALLNLLSHPVMHNHQWLTWLFVFGQLFFLVLGFLRIKPLFSSFMIWFLTANLFLKGSLFFTGGELLINYLLFYLIFIQKTDKNQSNYNFQNVLNNTFYIIILIQICLLYFFSCFWKLYDPNWTNGMALYYVAQIDTFSSIWLKTIFINNIWLAKIATFTVLVYQGSFAIMVWVKKIKIPFLILGVVFHLLIAIGMGIFTFGFIMIICYILFLETKHIKWLKDKFKYKKKSQLIS